LASWSLLFAAASAHHDNSAILPIAALGTVLAPSFGHWYSGELMSRGSWVRLLGLGIAVAAAIPAFQCSEDCRQSKLIEGAALAGVGLYIAGTVDDIVTAPGAARAANQRRHSIALVPMVRRDRAGLLLSARF